MKESYTYLIIEDEPFIRKGTIKKLVPMASLVSCIGEAENGKIGSYNDTGTAS